MTEEAINPLRRRMIEDMTIRNFDQRTQQTYIRSVRSCCRYSDRRPAELTFEDVRQYQLHLVQCGLAPASINGAMVAVDYIPIVREPQRLPVVLTPDDRVGIKMAVSLHTLRHCFATHLLEQNVDVRVIQVLLGHKKLETTAVYTHVAAKTLDGIDSPLDLLKLRPPPA